MAKDGNSKWVTGRVARMVKERGFAFLRADGDTDKGKDVFCHMTALAHGGFDHLQEGDRVRWTVASDADLEERQKGKGPRAAVAERL